jgi:hypothetical protein
MKFSTLQKAYFNADDGAYSLVTENDGRRGKSQFLRKLGCFKLG